MVPIVPAVSPTLLHGFARNYHNQPVTICGDQGFRNEDVIVYVIDIS